MSEKIIKIDSSLSKYINVLEVIEEKINTNKTLTQLLDEYNIKQSTFTMRRNELILNEYIIKQRKGQYTLTDKGKNALLEHSKYTSSITKAIELGDYPKKYIVSSATSKTQTNLQFWNALLNYKEYISAELFLIPCYYKNISLMSSRTSEDEEFTPEVSKYITHDRVNIGDNLIIMGDVPISPTAKHPLTGFDTISGNRSAIFGTPNLAMTTVATPSLKLPKLLYTTGTISKPNYSNTKTGKIAESHHVNSALIIELESPTLFHIRNLVWDSISGTFYDLDKKITVNGVIPDNSVPALVLGDLHEKFLDKDVKKATFDDKNSLVNRLRPESIVIHDSLDFYSRNHHTINNKFDTFKKWKNEDLSIKDELDSLVKFHNKVLHKTGAKVIYVDSNHDRALDNYLTNIDLKGSKNIEPENMIIYHELSLLKLKHIVKHGYDTNVLSLYMKDKIDTPNALFLDGTQNYDIHGILISSHGDRGINGSRGSIKAFGSIGQNAIIGHSHSPGIILGGKVFQTGTSSILNLDYVSGASSWLNSHVVVYKNGKCSLINIIEGKYTI